MHDIIIAAGFHLVRRYRRIYGNDRRDEQKALGILKNKELQKPVIEEFDGCFTKELGDVCGLDTA